MADMQPVRLGYLPALDGLRAVAVALVVAYHLEFGWATGGFLGVDLFFVISGFLITTLLLRERSLDGRISLRSFWNRRFRRLVPPLAVMTALTLVATRLYGLPEQWNAIRWDAAAALGYVANWRFITGGQSYFETLLGPSPLRHTWSLAVEEQWYVFWPLVVAGFLVVVARWPRLARLPLVLIGGAAIASAVLMAALFEPSDPTRVYFGTDTRAQQLLIGAGLAWILSRQRSTASPATSAWARLLVLLAFGAFLFIALTVSDQAPWLYRGGFFVVSLLAAVIVWAVSSPDRGGPLDWLGNAPFVWLGTRSYGVYLWHWPVIVFVGPPMGIDIARMPLAVLQVALTLALAEVSFRVVERPLRTTTWHPGFVIGGWTAISLATIAIATVALVPPDGRNLVAGDVITPSLPTTTSTATTATLAPLAADESANARPPDARTPDPTTTTTTTTTQPPPPERTALVVGDSTAFSAMVGYDQTPPIGWTIDRFATIGCTTTEGQPMDVGLDFGIAQADRCVSWRDDWAFWRSALDPDVVVVMNGAWEVLDHLFPDGPRRFPSEAWTATVRKAMDEALDIAGEGGRPVAVLALPCMQQNEDSVFSAQARNDQQRVDAFNTLWAEVAATKPNVRVLDLPGLLCPGGAFLEQIDGEVVRSDGVHVTPAGADLLVDWLVGQLDEQFPETGGTSLPTRFDTGPRG